jgi:hypothetical protein
MVAMVAKAAKAARRSTWPPCVGALLALGSVRWRAVPYLYRCVLGSRDRRLSFVRAGALCSEGTILEAVPCVGSPLTLGWPSNVQRPLSRQLPGWSARPTSLCSEDSLTHHYPLTAHRLLTSRSLRGMLERGDAPINPPPSFRAYPSRVHSDAWRVSPSLVTPQ